MHSDDDQFHFPLPEWQEHLVYVRSDGSYLITLSGDLYHVPRDGRFYSLWKEITDWLEENQMEALPEPADYLPNKDQRINEIQVRLAQIDLESSRPLRAWAAGKGSERDRLKLVELENEADTLREELKNLLV